MTTGPIEAKVQGGALDRAYLSDLAQRAGLTDLLERALNESGLPPD